VVNIPFKYKMTFIICQATINVDKIHVLFTVPYFDIVREKEKAKTMTVKIPEKGMNEIICVLEVSYSN